MFLPMERPSSLDSHATDFARAFLPPGAADAHSLLFDLEVSLEFTPDPDRLGECLDGYMRLLQDFHPPNPSPLGSMPMMEASELALAYLKRASKSTLEAVEHGLFDNLRKEGTRILREAFADSQYEQFRRFDGPKRVQAIVDFLEGLN